MACCSSSLDVILISDGEIDRNLVKQHLSGDLAICGDGLDGPETATV